MTNINNGYILIIQLTNNLNTMPNKDGTGPNGEGFLTGRGLGKCEKSTEDQTCCAQPRMRRGCGNGFRRRNQQT